MSAIFGVLNLDGRPVPGEELGRMRDALLAHGPDGDGIWLGGAIGMGHCLMRFAPEDSFERQPLAGCGGKAVLVADARIDNRRELAARFGLSSREAATLPDSAFILKAYEKWDRECVRHLEGNYAFALWDERTRVLFAACAPAGERPLHYHSTPRGFAFATMPRGLLALQGVPRVLNEAKVADYLARTQRELDSTFYEGIHRLRGGHHLTVGPQGLQITRYWSPDPGRRIRFKNDDDYAAAFLELFDRVVADHLRSATPAGVLMSGGLDSSSVAVTAAGLLPQGRRLAAYTEVPRIGFAGPVPAKRYGDETALVQAIARDNDNMDLKLVRTNGRYFLENLDAFFAHAECPFRNPSNQVWWEAILRLAREEGNRVLLHGSMGNLTASWTGAGLLQELVREGQWKQALREARSTVGRGAAAGRLLAASGFLPQLPACLLGPLARWRCDADNPPYFPLEWAPIHPGFVAEQGLRTHLDQEFKAAHYRERARKRAVRAEATTAQPDLSAPVSTGHRSLFGVDTRDPLGDRRIVEFCLALPESQYRRDGETRRLIRHTMADRLPPEVLLCRAKGVQAADWRERQELARPRIAETLAAMERSPAARRILDTVRLRRLFNTWPENKSDEQKYHLDYKFTFQAGLMVGRFLIWFEHGG